MDSKYIPKITTLTAGAITSIITIVNKMDVVYSLELLLASLIIFYVLGWTAKKIIDKINKENNQQRMLREQEEREAERQKELEAEQLEQESEESTAEE